MLSRVAENLYWLARYMERAENTARLILVNANLLLDLPRGVSPGWAPLVRIVDGTEAYRESGRKFTERGVTGFLVGDVSNPGSIVSCLSSAREDARTVRDSIPREIWEHVNDLHLYALAHLKGGVLKSERHRHLQKVIQGAQTFTGMLEGTMNTGLGHAFLCTGRYLERADMTSRIVNVRSEPLLQDEGIEGLRPFENIQWMSVLKSLTAYQMYRLRMRTRVNQAAVLQFLVLDDEFPRALLYCVNAAEAQVSRLPEPDDTLRVIARVKRQLRETRLQRVTVDSLGGYIDALQAGLAEVHNALVAAYFDPDITTD